MQDNDSLRFPDLVNIKSFFYIYHVPQLMLVLICSVRELGISSLRAVHSTLVEPFSKQCCTLVSWGVSSWCKKTNLLAYMSPCNKMNCVFFCYFGHSALRLFECSPFEVPAMTKHNRRRYLIWRCIFERVAGLCWNKVFHLEWYGCSSVLMKNLTSD